MQTATQAVAGTNEVRLSILAVDDTPTMLVLLRAMLKADYDVTAVESGEQAIAALRRRPFDLILLDLMMPDMDGFETLRHLRELPHFAATPVIFLTSASDHESQQSALEMGADDYIVKPFVNTLVRLRIANLIQRVRLQNELELSLDSADQGLWEWDLSTGRIRINARRGEQLAPLLPEKEAGDANWAAFCHPDSRPAIEHARREFLQGKAGAFDVDAQLRNRNGHWIWVNIYGKATATGPDGEIRRIKGTYRNIERRKRAENALKSSEERLRHVMEATGEGIWDWHLPSDVITHNPSWCRQLGLGEHLLEHPLAYFKALVHPDDLGRVETVLADCLDKRTDYVSEHRLRHASGDYIWVLDHGKVVECDTDDRPVRIVGAIRDITERKKIEAEFERMALYDSLTGLPNRRLLADRLDKAIAGNQRHGNYGALLFIDMDRFKQLNDTLGHDFGDQLLIEVGRRLNANIRSTDSAARLGGDEFIVLLTELGKQREMAADCACAIAEKIRAALNLPYRLDAHEYRSTPSIGLSLFAGEPDNAEAILKRADAAMYRAKAAGRNCLHLEA